MWVIMRLSSDFNCIVNYSPYPHKHNEVVVLGWQHRIFTFSWGKMLSNVFFHTYPWAVWQSERRVDLCWVEPAWRQLSVELVHTQRSQTDWRTTAFRLTTAAAARFLQDIITTHMYELQATSVADLYCVQTLCVKLRTSAISVFVLWKLVSPIQNLWVCVITAPYSSFWFCLTKKHWNIITVSCVTYCET